MAHQIHISLANTLNWPCNIIYCFKHKLYLLLVVQDHLMVLFMYDVTWNILVSKLQDLILIDFCNIRIKNEFILHQLPIILRGFFNSYIITIIRHFVGKFMMSSNGKILILRLVLGLAGEWNMWSCIIWLFFVNLENFVVLAICIIWWHNLIIAYIISRDLNNKVKFFQTINLFYQLFLLVVVLSV